MTTLTKIKPTMPMYLNGLMVTQNGIRDHAQLVEMIDYVRSGGLFTIEAIKAYHEASGNPHRPQLFQVAVFPDHVRFVEDGHHRALACVLGGRTWLEPSEYEIEHWRYEDYLSINFDRKWVTPYDPRVHIRVSDFGAFKRRALEIRAESETKAIEFILSNPDSYRVPRDIGNVEQMVRLRFDSLLREPARLDTLRECGRMATCLP